MGAVFLADDLRLPGRQCAVKECLRAAGHAALEASAHAALEREVAVLARLDHPALPHVTDHFQEDGQLYLVMDFVAGMDLKELIVDARGRGRTLDAAQVVAWAEDLCRALSYLHRQDPPIIHRDVKPANVKLTTDGQVRLVDFGLAVPAGGSQTVTVVPGGSRAYQPLEQYGDARCVDPRSDVYALGATLYHALCGHPPPAAQERFVAHGLLSPLSELRPDLDSRVATAIMSALALHPDDRPASAEELRRLLVGGAPAAPAAPDQWSGALRQNAWLIVTALTLLLAALAVTVGAP